MTLTRSPAVTPTVSELVSGEPEPQPGDIVRELTDRIGMGDTLTHVVVSEEFPANPDVVLSPGQSVQPQLGNGRIVELQPGNYGNQTISPGHSVYLFCRTPYGAVFQAPSIGNTEWVSSGGNDVTLRGIKTDRFGPTSQSGSESAGAWYIPSGSTGWKIWDCEISRAASSGIRWRGSGHETRRLRINHCGRYGWSHGFDVLMIDTEVHHISTGGSGNPDPQTSGGDNGVCKMPGGSSGMDIRGLTAWDINGMGLWWDGARDGKGRDVHITNINRAGVSVEVGWGGARTNPHGGSPPYYPDPAFEIENVHVEQQYGDNTSFPKFAPAAVKVEQNPGVAFRNVYARSVTSGMTAVYNSTHPLYSSGYPAQGISAQWCRDNMGLYNIWFEDSDIDGVNRWHGGITHESSAFGGPAWDNRVWRGNTYGPNPVFFNPSGDNLTLAQWRAAGYDVQ